MAKTAKDKTGAEEFLEKYKKLVEESGFRLVSSPMWRYSQETGDYRLLIQRTVQKVDNNG